MSKPTGYAKVNCPRCGVRFHVGYDADGEYECDEHYKPFFFTIENGIVMKQGFEQSPESCPEDKSKTLRGEDE